VVFCLVCQGQNRKSNDVCRVGGFTTNSKPIVKIGVEKNRASGTYVCTQFSFSPSRNNKSTRSPSYHKTVQHKTYYLHFNPSSPSISFSLGQWRRRGPPMIPDSSSAPAPPSGLDQPTGAALQSPASISPAPPSNPPHFASRTAGVVPATGAAFQSPASSPPVPPSNPLTSPLEPSMSSPPISASCSTGAAPPPAPSTPRRHLAFPQWLRAARVATSVVPLPYPKRRHRLSIAFISSSKSSSSVGMTFNFSFFVCVQFRLRF
jgi:hypothetical protein